MIGHTITLPKGPRCCKASVSRRSLIAMLAVPVMDKAIRLDREADNTLAWGQHQRAETLSRRATELREGVW